MSSQQWNTIMLLCTAAMKTTYIYQSFRLVKISARKKNQKLNEDIELEARPTEKQWLNWEKQNKKGV